MGSKLNGRLEAVNRILAVLMALSLAGCGALPVVEAGPAVSLGAAETIRGMQSVLQEGAGTSRLQTGEQVLLASPPGGGYALTFLNGHGAEVNGLYQGVFSFSDLLGRLEADGWKYVGPGAVPATVSKVIMGYTIEAVMTGLSCLPSVFVLPVILLTPMPAPVFEENLT